MTRNEFIASIGALFGIGSVLKKEAKSKVRILDEYKIISIGGSVVPPNKTIRGYNPKGNYLVPPQKYKEFMREIINDTGDLIRK